MARVLTISELESGGPKDPIWCLNTSANSDAGQAGEIHVGIPKQNGTKIDPLFIPKTWLPQELTLQIPRAQLIDSSEFRQTINKGLITLIDAASAKAILAQEGAEEEQRRLDDLRRHIRQAGAAKTISASGSEITMISGGEEEAVDNTGEKDVTAEGDSGLSPGFAMFAERLREMDDVNALNAIRSRRKFSGKELRYLKSNLPDKPKTVKAITAQLTRAAKK